MLYFILVVVNEQDDSNFGNYENENNEVVQEIYDADMNVVQSNGTW